MISYKSHTERTCVLDVPDLIYEVYRNVKTHKPLLWGGVIYLSTQSLLLDSSLLYSDS